MPASVLRQLNASDRSSSGWRHPARSGEELAGAALPERLHTIRRSRRRRRYPLVGQRERSHRHEKKREEKTRQVKTPPLLTNVASTEGVSSASAGGQVHGNCRFLPLHPSGQACTPPAEAAIK